MFKRILFACTFLLVGCDTKIGRNSVTSNEKNAAASTNEIDEANEMDAAALAESSEAVPDCGHIEDHVTLRRCTVLERDRADQALSDQFKTTLKRLREVNNEDFTNARAQGFATDQYLREQEGYVTSLLRSQQAWLTYRKEFCNVARFPGRGGNSNLENFVNCELPII